MLCSIESEFRCDDASVVFFEACVCFYVWHTESILARLSSHVAFFVCFIYNLKVSKSVLRRRHRNWQ